MRPTGETIVERRGTVLVVDDEALLRRLVDRTLTSAGFNTVISSSVQEAAQVLHESGDSLDVVLTDLRLGDGSGIEIVGAARADAPEAVIVVMTALATVSNAVAAMRAGA